MELIWIWDLVGRVGRTLATSLTYVVTTASLTLSTFAVYRIAFHPLSGIPGPKLAALSNVWYAYQVRNGRAAILGKTLHRKYGPVVRVGPNEVWFDSKEAFDIIYGTSGKGLDKSDFYLATSLSKPQFDRLLKPTFPDTLDLLSERDVKRYRIQRRLIGPTYKAANVAKYGKAVDKTLEKIIERLNMLQGQKIDLKEWMHITAVECLGASVLSWSPGMLKAGTDWSSSKHSYMGWRRKSVFGLFPFMSKMDMWSSTLGRRFGNLWGVTFPTPKNFRAFFPDVARKVKTRCKSALSAHPTKDVRNDLLADLILLHQERPEFTAQYLTKMAMTNFGAGHETMASTLTSVLCTLGSNENIQQQVRNEISQAAKPIDLSDQTQLQLTRAVIKETMRLRPVIAMGLPRETASDLVIGGRWIPRGTTVGCNPIALHRNEAICGSTADDFQPQRWLDDAERLKSMERYNLSWGGGSRSCPGRHLAELIVLRVVVAMVKSFEIDVAIPPEEEMPSYFLSMMTGVSATLLSLTD